MLALVCVLLAAPFAEQAPGLIANGSFEQLRGDRPDRWDVFVAPFPKAPDEASVPTARLSREGHGGGQCTVLESPIPYPSEPFNNWSQNLIGNYAGMHLRASGWIKTENADGAALWVQCWRRDPLRVIYVANTSDSTPCYGTSDWREVSVEFDVPPQTAFLTLRCVLKGAGKAWFDDIQLTELKPSEVPAAIAEPVKPKAPEKPVAASPALPPKADAALSSQPVAMAETPKAVPAPIAPPELPAVEIVASEAGEDPVPEPEESATSEETAVIEAEIARLKNVNADLAGALGAMQSNNRELVDQLAALQAQMKALQEALGSTSRQPAPDAVPPLVPRDYKEGTR